MSLAAGNVYVAQSSEAANAGAIQRAVNLAGTNDIIDVQAGAFVGNVAVNKSVSIIGPNAAYDPNTNATPANAQAVVEPSAASSADNSSVFYVTANNVTIQGLTIQGTNPGLSSGGYVLEPGETVYAAAGVSNVAQVSSFSAANNLSGLVLENNLIKSFKWDGVFLSGSDSAPASGDNDVVRQNYVTDLPGIAGNPWSGYGILLGNDIYGSVVNNKLTAVSTAVEIWNQQHADAGGGSVQVTGNNVSASSAGVYLNTSYYSATVSGNTISLDTTLTPASYNVGLVLESLEGSAATTVQSNNVSGFQYGVEMWNLVTSSTVTLQGGTLSNNSYGVYVTNNDPLFGGGGRAWP